MSTSEVGSTTSSTGWKPRLVAVVGAAVGALVVWLIAGLADVEVRSPAFGSQASMEIGAGFVIVISLLAGLAGWTLLAVLERFTARPRTVWVVIAAVVLLLSLGGPWSGTDITTGSRLTLTLMHLAVGAVLIPLLARTATPRGR
jgi:hypothetical protein